MTFVRVSRNKQKIIQLVALAVALFTSFRKTFGQPVPGGVCKPVSERTSEVGCWIVANNAVGAFPAAEVFWHLETFPTRADAEAAKGPHGTVVESFGKIWLLTVERKGWHPDGGERVAEIGPIPIKAGENYSTQYMEVVFNPGMTARAHRHGGPEAWYTLTGETCLETPNGRVIGRAGGPPVIIPDGPMHLTATGTEQRRALVLILHETSKPATTMAQDWTPKGLCKQ